MLEEHPELETTKFSPEVDWNASMWPVNQKNMKNSSNQVCAFQYKLKSQSLLTPARYLERQTAPKNISLTTDTCVVCKHPTQKADLQHIFSHCTVAGQHNQQLWKDIQGMFQDSPVDHQPWFSTHDWQDSDQYDEMLEIGDTCWQASLGDLGYIPKAVTSCLSKEDSEVLQKTINCRISIQLMERLLAKSNSNLANSTNCIPLLLLFFAHWGSSPQCLLAGISACSSLSGSHSRKCE